MGAEAKMSEPKKIEALAGATGYLCSAYDELLNAGYKAWGAELKQLIEILGIELDWLERDSVNAPVPSKRLRRWSGLTQSGRASARPKRARAFLMFPPRPLGRRFHPI